MTNQTTNKKLLDQVRDTIRLKHYALSTEESYLLWIKRYIIFHKTEQGFVHPNDMGCTEIEAFLTTWPSKKTSPPPPKIRPSARFCFSIAKSSR